MDTVIDMFTSGAIKVLIKFIIISRLDEVSLGWGNRESADRLGVLGVKNC